jgi:NADH-quinone oxidoreductase subunit N
MLEPISVSLASLNLATLAPMLILIGGGLIILCIDLIVKNLSKQLYVILSVLFLILDLGAVLGYQGASRGFLPQKAHKLQRPVYL